MPSHQTMTRATAVLIASVLSLTSVAQDKPAPPTTPGVPPAMTTMMDPAVYAKMMQNMVNPLPLMTDPTAACAPCHTEEEVQRYEQTMGPMLRMMMNPMNWMNPNAYAGMMSMMMNPNLYNTWFNAMMQKYGAAVPGASTQPGPNK